MQEGTRIDQWVIDRVLGLGGMGAVYLCHHHADHSTLVAMKCLGSAAPDASGRFVREAKILASLDHPAIPKFLGFSFDPCYLVMEYVHGKSLQQVQRPQPVDRVLSIGLQLAEALVYVHAQGVTHRDIKPANVIVQEDGWIKLVDFGISLQDGGTRHTQVGTLMGTLAYVPPEALEIDSTDGVSWDLYSMGVMLYELLTGQVAFASGDGPRAAREGRILRLKSSMSHLDPGAAFTSEVRALIRDLTARTPERRMRTAAGAARAMRAIIYPTSMASPRRGALLLGLAAGALLILALLVLGVAVWFVNNTREHPPTATAAFTVTMPKLDGHVVSARLDGHDPSRVSAGGFEFVLPVRDEYRLQLLVGEACNWDLCPGEQCSPCCVVQDHPIHFTEAATGGGMTAAYDPGDLGSTGARNVLLQVGEWSTATALRARLSGQGGRRESTLADDGAVHFELVPPGTYQIELIAGACSAEATGCAGGAAGCPPGCASTRAPDLTLTCGVGDFMEDESAAAARLKSEIQPREPAVAASAAPKVVVATQEDRPPPQASVAPTPQPESVGPRAPAAAVTVGAFRRWLETHPDWDREAAIARGAADESYLRNLASKADSDAVTEVSWFVAKAYCAAGHGGLLGVTESPNTWTASEDSPKVEWRMGPKGSVAWRTSSGSADASGNPSATASNRGFRCLR